MDKQEYQNRLEKILQGINVNDMLATDYPTAQATAIKLLNEEAIGADEENATRPGEVLFTDRIGYVKIEDVSKLNSGNRNQLRQELKQIIGGGNE